MTPAEFFRELAYPFRSGGVFIALLTFLLLGAIIVVAIRLLGTFALVSAWLAIVLVVAFMRYMMMIADARAMDADAAPPGAEYFSLIGNAWTLFPAVILLSVAFLADELRNAGLESASLVFIAAAVLLFPAMIGVLTITHSPWQSINPLAIGNYVRKLGPHYLYSIAAAALPGAVAVYFRELPLWLMPVLGLYSAAAFFAVVGGLARTGGLIDEVGIDEAIDPGDDATAEVIEKQRSDVIDHAYGLASRGNREGGLGHIVAWLDADPDPESARAWFFERMLTWESREPALAFAQRWLSELLAAGEATRSVKVMLRCRMIEPRFRPLPEDLDHAVHAAGECNNPELAEALRRL